MIPLNMSRCFCGVFVFAFLRDYCQRSVGQDSLTAIEKCSGRQSASSRSSSRRTAPSSSSVTTGKMCCKWPTAAFGSKMAGWSKKATRLRCWTLTSPVRLKAGHPGAGRARRLAPSKPSTTARHAAKPGAGAPDITPGSQATAESLPRG